MMIPYNALFDLVSTYVFGGVTAGSYQELACILVAMIGCLFIVAVPFMVVLKLIKLFVGR